MPRSFGMQSYDSNGTTPTQNAINQRNASIQAQNNLAKSGGGTITVPQTAPPTGAAVGPYNSNASIAKMAGAQLNADNNASYSHCTGQSASACGAKTGGSTRRRRRYKKKRRSIYGYRK